MCQIIGSIDEKRNRFDMETKRSGTLTEDGRGILVRVYNCPITQSDCICKSEKYTCNYLIWATEDHIICAKQ